MTGFGLVMSGDKSNSTSSLVTGKVYGPDYAGSMPTKMTQAIADMESIPLQFDLSESS